jgi:hypothetical protein
LKDIVSAFALDGSRLALTWNFLWRPFLRDADDEMVLELAFAAGCRHIVTHNVKDFEGSDELGITALSPRGFLDLIRKKS